MQGWGEYWTYEYEYWKISTRVVLEYNVFSIFMFIILGKTSTRVVLAPALLQCNDDEFWITCPVWSHYSMAQHNMILHTSVAEAENKSEFAITLDTPHLTLEGKLWGVNCEDIVGNQPHHNGTALYIVTPNSYPLYLWDEYDQMRYVIWGLGPLLLTWINFNTSMDKWSHAQ